MVLLDTNALFLPIRTGFPLEAEVARLVPGARIVIASSGIRELERLDRRSTPGAAGAKLLAEKFASVPASADGDAGVIEAAMRERAIVMTADRALQERLRALGLSVLAPRDRHRLELRPSRRPRQDRTVGSPRTTSAQPLRRLHRGNG
ncbi:MAG: PIN domain-containing protein [Thermoplasmata archaeon]